MAELNLYEVSIGDGDILKVRAKSLASLERRIRAGEEFAPWMINSVRVAERGDCPCEACRKGKTA